MAESSWFNDNLHPDGMSGSFLGSAPMPKYGFDSGSAGATTLPAQQPQQPSAMPTLSVPAITDRGPSSDPNYQPGGQYYDAPWNDPNSPLFGGRHSTTGPSMPRTITDEDARAQYPGLTRIGGTGGNAASQDAGYGDWMRNERSMNRGNGYGASAGARAGYGGYQAPWMQGGGSSFRAGDQMQHLQAPDGSIQAVPQQHAPHYLSRGAKPFSANLLGFGAPTTYRDFASGVNRPLGPNGQRGPV